MGNSWSDAVRNGPTCRDSRQSGSTYCIVGARDPTLSLTGLHVVLTEEIAGAVSPVRSPVAAHRQGLVALGLISCIGCGAAFPGSMAQH